MVGWAGVHHMSLVPGQGAALKQRSVCGVSKALAVRQGVVVKAHELPCRHAEPLLHLHTPTCLVTFQCCVNVNSLRIHAEILESLQ